MANAPSKVELYLRKFEGKGYIPGMVGNFFCYANGFELLWKSGSQRQRPEGADGLEVDLASSLCRYLFSNGVHPRELQVLSNCKERVKQLKIAFENTSTKLHKKTTVSFIDDESVFAKKPYTILSLASTGVSDEERFMSSILEAIDLSLRGVIVIIPFKFIAGAKKLSWKQLVDFMFRLGFVVPYLRIFCKTHKLTAFNIQKGEDLRNAAPLGGCQSLCRRKECGHYCGMVCHPGISHGKKGIFRCLETCSSKCINSHECTKTCGEVCNCINNCNFRLPCGHIMIGDKKKCLAPCDFILPCGHKCEKLCKDCFKPNITKEDRHAMVICRKPCNRACHRGHICSQGHQCNKKCPPCKGVIEKFQLLCGHTVKVFCSEQDGDFDQNSYICKEPCRRLYGMCNHRCVKLCFEECGECEEVYSRPHPVCGHLTTTQCQVPIVANCEKLIPPFNRSKCKHLVRVPCYLAHTLSSEEVMAYCREKCDIVDIEGGNCAHDCFGNCSRCHQGRFHLRCSYPCDKPLFCGHKCTVPCPIVCPPCNSKCMVSCEHYECPFACGVPCDFTCLEPCPYSCPHLKCTKPCGEICDRPPCFEPCIVRLKCGHNCVGFCGEICPPVCRHCNPEKLTDILDLDADFSSHDKRFVYLQPCCHIIEETSLESWLSIGSVNGEIKLRTCPICLYPLALTMRRYGPLIHHSWCQVREIKAKVFGDEGEIVRTLKNICDKIEERLLDGNEYKFMDFSSLLQDMCRRPLKQKRKEIGKKGEFQSMYLGRAKFLEWAFGILDKAEDSLIFYQHIWGPQFVQRYLALYRFIFRLISSRPWPLHPNEMNGIGSELRRARDVERLYSRVGLDVDERARELGNSWEGKQRFGETEELLFLSQHYSRNLEERVKETFMMFVAVQNYTLELSEVERVEIVRAFGTQAGRWFKCPNGHVYVVTECGGVTEKGQCNECGESIGGENHQVVKFNTLATEMDGAEEPLYPTALQRH